MANVKCLGVPRAQEEIILVTEASNVGGGGRLFSWQALEKEEFDSAITQRGTDGLNRDGHTKQPRCTGRVPRRKTDGSGNRTRQ